VHAITEAVKGSSAAAKAVGTRRPV